MGKWGVEGRGEKKRNQMEGSSKRTRSGDKVLTQAQRGDRRAEVLSEWKNKKFKFTDAFSEPELHYRMMLVFTVLPLELQTWPDFWPRQPHCLCFCSSTYVQSISRCLTLREHKCVCVCCVCVLRVCVRIKSTS